MVRYKEKLEQHTQVGRIRKLHRRRRGRRNQLGGKKTGWSVTTTREGSAKNNSVFPCLVERFLSIGTGEIAGRLPPLTLGKQITSCEGDGNSNSRKGVTFVLRDPRAPDSMVILV